MTTFGRGMLEHWMLDPESTYLNHGTVGAPPRRVLQRQQALRDEMEPNSKSQLYISPSAIDEISEPFGNSIHQTRSGL